MSSSARPPTKDAKVRRTNVSQSRMPYNARDAYRTVTSAIASPIQATALAARSIPVIATCYQVVDRTSPRCPPLLRLPPARTGEGEGSWRAEGDHQQTSIYTSTCLCWSCAEGRAANHWV
jgi:hypothetical protein